MTFRHVRTDDPTQDPANDSRTRLLERLLTRHADDGLDVLELRVQMGKSGYVATPHRWEDDGEGDHLSDDSGEALLIGGMTPGDLAVELVDTARQHVDENGERKNYRIVGLRHVEGDDDGEEQEQLFRFLLPATMFGAAPDPSTSSDSRENHDAMMSANQQIQRQNDQLFRVLMDVVRQYPIVLAKVTELLEQLGDQLGGGRQHDLQQVLSILEFESGRDERWMSHDRSKQRADHRADLAGKAVDLAGPDVMTLLRDVVATVMSGNSRAQGEDAPDTAPPSSESEPTRSRLATRLNDALAQVPKTGIGKARLLVDEDEWRLIETARGVATDEEFAALFRKLQELWTARGEEATKELMGKLIEALGLKPAMTLGALIREVNNL